jgi:hypothetical protein
VNTETLSIEGITLPLRATPLARLVKCKEVFTSGIGTESGADAFAEALFWGIRRAGGEVTLDWLKLNIDVHNRDDLFAAFVRVNTPQGMSVDTPGEGVAGSQS